MPACDRFRTRCDAIRIFAVRLLKWRYRPFSEYFKFARRRERSGKPLQLGFDAGGLIVLQNVFEQRHCSPKATNPYTHLMHTLGIHFYDRWHVVSDLLQTGKANHLETLPCGTGRRQLHRNSLDGCTPAAINEFVATLRLALK